MIRAGTPLHEALNGSDVRAFGSAGKPFSADVIGASGFDVTQSDGPSNGPAPSSDITGLVLSNRPTPGGM